MAAVSMNLKLRATVILLCFVTLIANPGSWAEEIILDSVKRTIVLDPGHGGADAGARGPSGSQEKAVTLTLARLLENELSSHFNVHLTRTDDYHLNAIERAAIANHLQADLFISLHTAASFSPGTKGLWVYYCTDRGGISANAGARPPPPAAVPPALKIWDDLFREHRSASQHLAKVLEHQLAGMQEFSQSRITGLPLAVLKGVNAPAVMVETGYLSNPIEEKCLIDGKCLTQIARTIAQGVIVFFDEKAEPPLETIDLQE